MNPYYMTPETMAALKAEAQRLGQRLQDMRAQRSLPLAELLGPNVDADFVRAAERAQGYKDYPSFDMEYQHSEAYTEGYSAAYHAEMDAREEREATDREFPRSAAIDRRNGL